MTDRLHILKELRDRLAAAIGPDRELDIELACAFDGFEQRLPARPGRFDFRVRRCGEIGWQETLRGINEFTGSRDAADTLRPDWAEYTLSTLYGIAHFECPLNAGDTGPQSFSVRRKDGDVVLAICQWRVEYEIARAEAEATEKAAG